MASDMASKCIDLGHLRSREGDTFLHLLCRNTLRERKKDFKRKLDKMEYARLKDATNAVKINDMLSAVTTLLDSGCEVNCVNESGDTPLDVLCDVTYHGLLAKIEKQKRRFIIECDSVTLQLFQAVVDARAKASGLVLKKIVKMTYMILLHNQSVVGQTWTPSQEELKKTPIAIFTSSGKMVLTDICQCIVNKLSQTRNRLDPTLVLKVLCVYLNLIYTNVLRGSLLVYLLKNIGMRFDEEHEFAHVLLFGDKESLRHETSHKDTDMLYALDEVISTLAGAKGCDAIRHRCPQNGTTPLHLAVVLGLKDMVSYFLQHPLAKINILDDEGNSPLMAVLNIMRHSRVWASSRLGVYLGIAIELANENIQNFDLKDKFGSTPLLYCVEAISALGAQYREHRLYEQAYRDPQCRKHTMPMVVQGQSAVMLCVVENLLQAISSIISHHPVPDLMAVDPKGRTALHLCGPYGRNECAELLIVTCPSLCSVPDHRGNTALFYLVEHLPGDEALQLLTKHASMWKMNRRNSVNQSALDYYKEQLPKSKRDRDLEKAMSHFAEADQFRNSFPADPGLMAGNSFSSINGHSKRDSIRRSISKIFRPESREAERLANHNTTTHTHHRNNEYLQFSVSANDEGKPLKGHLEDIAKFQRLFQRIASKTTKVNAQNTNKRTATMVCAENGLCDELDYIIKNLHPDLDITDGQGMTALHMTAKKKQSDCAHVLLNASSININAKDKLGNSAIFYIVENFTPNEAVKILGNQKLEWDLNIRNNFDQTAYEYYMEKLTQRHLNEHLANVLARRCIPPLPRLVADRSSTASTPRPRDRLTPGAAYGSTTFFGSESDLSNQRWLRVLKKYRIYFIEHFESHPLFYSYLIQTRAMDEYTSNRIQNKAVPELDKATDIFEYITKKDEKAFRCFIEALRKSSQDIIADELESALEDDNMGMLETRP